MPLFQAKILESLHEQLSFQDAAIADLVFETVGRYNSTGLQEDWTVFSELQQGVRWKTDRYFEEVESEKPENNASRNLQK